MNFFIVLAIRNYQQTIDLRILWSFDAQLSRMSSWRSKWAFGGFISPSILCSFRQLQLRKRIRSLHFKWILHQLYRSMIENTFTQSKKDTGNYCHYDQNIPCPWWMTFHTEERKPSSLNCVSLRTRTWRNDQTLFTPRGIKMLPFCAVLVEGDDTTWFTEERILGGLADKVSFTLQVVKCGLCRCSSNVFGWLLLWL